MKNAGRKAQTLEETVHNPRFISLAPDPGVWFVAGEKGGNNRVYVYKAMGK